MIMRTLLAVIAAAQLAVWPAMAQTATDTTNGHHYSGGPHPLPAGGGDAPKPRHVRTGVAADTTNGHHYSAGPHPLPARSGDAPKPRHVRTGVAADTTNGHHSSAGPHPLPNP
jgi:hypothetical protein